MSAETDNPFSSKGTGVDLEVLQGQHNYRRWSRDFKLLAIAKGVWKIINVEGSILTKPIRNEYFDPIPTRRNPARASNSMGGTKDEDDEKTEDDTIATIQ